MFHRNSTVGTRKAPNASDITSGRVSVMVLSGLPTVVHSARHHDEGGRVQE